MILEPPTELRWLFLDLNSYFASVEQQCRPQLRGKPVAVVPLETDATCAIAASYEAKAYGIKTGTRIYEAKQKCPQLICIKASHERYVEYHHRIIETIEQLIPVTTIASIDEVACELDKNQTHPETALQLGRDIKQAIYQHVGESISCSIGIAPNQFLAKIATELEKPDGLVTIMPAEIPQKLFSLSFDDIPGIGRNMQKRLHYNGIYTIEQLYQLAPKHMRAIWHSVAGERMWYKLRGIELESDPTKRRTVGHSHVLAPENRPYPHAILVAKRLLLKAASRLRRMEFYTTIMSISLRIENGGRYGADITFKPACDNAQLIEHYEQCWQKVMSQCAYTQPRIKKIAVTLHGLVEAKHVQTDLFDYAQAKEKKIRNEKLSTAMDALNKRFGRNTLTTASTLGEANLVTGTKIAFSRIPDKDEFYE